MGKSPRRLLFGITQINTHSISFQLHSLEFQSRLDYRLIIVSLQGKPEPVFYMLKELPLFNETCITSQKNSTLSWNIEVLLYENITYYDYSLFV